MVQFHFFLGLKLRNKFEMNTDIRVVKGDDNASFGTTFDPRSS